jgi:hypothetical protein
MPWRTDTKSARNRRSAANRNGGGISKTALTAFR